jgi:hypothetical protein
MAGELRLDPAATIQIRAVAGRQRPETMQMIGSSTIANTEIGWRTLQRRMPKF